jgi:hypothetical protein
MYSKVLLYERSRVIGLVFEKQINHLLTYLLVAYLRICWRVTMGSWTVGMLSWRVKMVRV